jgi:hypothetical protein
MLSAWPPRDDEDRGPVKRSSVREMQQGTAALELHGEACVAVRTDDRRHARLRVRPELGFRLLVPLAGLARRRPARASGRT